MAVITQSDVNYTEEIVENLSAEDIREIYSDSLLLWVCGSGSGTGHPGGNYYCVLDYKGRTSFLEGEIAGVSTNVAMIEGFRQAVTVLKKPINIHLLTPCPLGFVTGFRGKGPNAGSLQAALEIVKEKKCTLTASVITGDVIRKFVMEQGGKNQEPKENRYKKAIYRECLEKVCQLLRKNGIDPMVIEQVRTIAAEDPN